MRRPALPLLRRSLAVVLVAAPFIVAKGQSVATESSAAAKVSSAKAPGERKVLQLEDFARWNRITSPALSPDGKWMTFTYSPNEGGQTILHVKAVDGTTDYTASVGNAAGGGRAGGPPGGRGGGGAGNAPSFTGDSRWAAYMVTPEARGGGGRGGAGRGRGGQGAASQETPAVAHLELLNLASGEKVTIPNAASWRFSSDSRWLAVKLNRAPGASPQAAAGAAPAAPTGADLIVRDMASGADRNIGNVNQFEFDDSGKLLAYTLDAPGRLGNGVYLLDPATGETRALNTAQAEFDQLTWSPSGTNLAVLRGEKTRGTKQRDNVLVAWLGVRTAESKSITYEPSKDASFPKGMVLSEYAAPRWSKDGSRIFVGVKEQEPEVPAADSNKANVDIWHWRDQTPQSVQIIQLQQLRRATLPAVILLSTNKLVKLGDDNARTIVPAANSSVAIARNDSAYRGEVAWGGSRADVYKVDVATGARTLIDKALSREYGTSPDSKWYLYLKNKQLRAFNLADGTSATLDASGVGGKTFVNEDDDHAYEKPIWGLGGWTKDGKSVLLYDKYDVWSVPLDGSKAVALTAGVGKAQGIQFRVVRFNAGGGRGGRGGGGGRGGAAAADSDGVDLSQPVTLSAYGDRTKKFGYWQVTAGQAPKPLIWEDKNVGGVIKAADADRLVFTEQDFDEFPDYWVTNSAFESPRKVTDANPILSEFAWASKKVLIDYKDRFGHQLQGTLTLPPGYEPGKKYPMLVEFYEIMSNTHHNFPVPGYADSPQISIYASSGYAVFQPDVVYEIGKPGTSAVDCVTSGVKKVIELGYADPKHIGLHGHSWGGYQSSYIVTQTDLFAAVVTGAPPTNLTSFYSELYKSTGTVQQGITTVGQVRMGVGVDPYTNTKMFEEQSPIFHVKNIKTPFMILQGGDDGAVDYVEGLQFFNAARTAGKQVIFLTYPGQPHNLTDRDDQKDFAIRMKQFFDHYLMDKPMPEWMANGLPQVRKGGPIR
jgi:dipeptidyl aminopeptidase/acylaminoacyl peptidase